MHPTPEQLAAAPLLSSLAPAELETIARWTEVRTAEAGDRLVGEDAAGYSFFILLSGSASVVKDGEELDGLAAGDFFGEMAILGEGRRTASVVATSPVTVASMFGTEFRQLEQELPQTAARIREAMVERLAARSQAS
jgi:CRP-like cAMP-binding protein